MHGSSDESEVGKLTNHKLGPPVVPFYQLFWGRVPLLKWTTEKKGTLILTSLLEDLDKEGHKKSTLMNEDPGVGKYVSQQLKNPWRRAPGPRPQSVVVESTEEEEWRACFEEVNWRFVALGSRGAENKQTREHTSHVKHGVQYVYMFIYT